MSEFEKWNVSSEVLEKAGWLPHYTTPFGYIAECGEGDEAVRSRLLNYYDNNWQNVRSEIEARLSGYKIDSEAKATLREALDAHEAGLYRCVCRVLFPEIERVFRAELFNSEIGRIGYEKFIRKLVDEPEDEHHVEAKAGVDQDDEKKSIDDFVNTGLYDLSLFEHLTKVIRDKDEENRKKKKRGEMPTPESDKSIFGLFTNVTSEEHRESLKQSAIPNRHAAIHGLVVYSSQQNSLNMIFLTDYIFQVIK